MFFSSPPTASTAGPSSPEVDRQRRIPAGSADRQLVGPVPVSDDAHHRVVARHLDRPVMVEDRVAERRKPVRGIVIGEADRLVGAVGTGQHQRVGHRPGRPGIGASSR